MHIAIFTDSYFPYVSGVTIAVRSQVLEFLKEGHKVSLFISKSKPSKAQKKDIFIKHVNLKTYEIGPSLNIKKYRDFRIAFPNLRRVSRIIKENRPDIVHIHTELSLGFCGKQVAHSLGIPIVGTFHTNFSDPQYLKTIGLFSSKLMHLGIKKYQKRFFSMCDALIVPSHYTYRELTDEKFHPNIVQISSGIVIPELKSKDVIMRMRKRFNIHKTKNVIVVGRLSQEKNIDTIIKAFGQVYAKLPQSRLIIIGDGPHTRKLKDLVVSYKLQHVVFFLGLIANSRITKFNLFRLADIYVTTSMTETLGLTTLEAMAQKVPVVGSPQKGLSDILTKNTALLCPPKNVSAVARTILSALTKRINTNRVNAAYALAKKHDRQLTAQKTLHIYERLLRH